MKLEELFVVRPTNEEQNDYIITIGQYLATEQHFSSREEAENYIATPQWDMILSIVGGAIKMHEKVEHNNKE